MWYDQIKTRVIQVKKQLIIAAYLIFVAINLNASPQAVITSSINSLVEKAMLEFNVPGVAIGIVKNNKVIHLQGYGTANIDFKNVVNKDTIFKIASNSKAFTSAALAMLVDQGKLRWDDRVTDFLPEFKMYNEWVTAEFNIRDLLTHRSGLRLGAGDLMLWPEPTKFSRADIVKNLRHLKPVSSFRDQYAYDNLLYIVAGEVVRAISGQPWELFVEQQIFKPLKMESCYAGGINVNKVTNIVAPHVILAGKLVVDTPNLINDKTSLMAAAGGIKCSSADLLIWVKMLLNGGVMADGKSLLSLKQRDIMWQPITRLSVPESGKQYDNMHYRGYALGWRISDYHGQWRISHTGSLSGSMSQIILLPDQQLGIVILTNQQSSSARNALARGLLQEFVNVEKTDWVAHYAKGSKATGSKEKVEEEPANQPIKITAADELLGVYTDAWFGDVMISKQAGRIIFQSDKTPRLVGELFYHQSDGDQVIWWAKWHDRSFGADAWLTFKKETYTKDKAKQKTVLTMKAISPTADWSFDFEDLKLVKTTLN
jgi:CubicO group peptidase (beta-lactamase class C family)